jgi:hypothetical protein
LLFYLYFLLLHQIPLLTFIGGRKKKEEFSVLIVNDNQKSYQAQLIKTVDLKEFLKASK